MLYVFPVFAGIIGLIFGGFIGMLSAAFITYSAIILFSLVLAIIIGWHKD